MPEGAGPGPAPFPTEPMSMAQAIRLWRDEEGLSSIEYGLVGALIAVACTAAIATIGLRTLDLYMLVCNGVALAVGNPPC